MTKAITAATANERWLSRYYLTRAAVSGMWIALAFSTSRAGFAPAAILLVAYPAWDCVANWYDASRNGGLARNPTQAFNAAASAFVAIVVAATSSPDFHAAIGVIGGWAALAGVLQLATAVRRRRRAAAQWPMILSGAQSALAGTHFLVQAADPSTQLGVATIAPYAAFGAIYFAFSAILLVARCSRALATPHAV